MKRNSAQQCGASVLMNTILSSDEVPIMDAKLSHDIDKILANIVKQLIDR